MIVREEQVIAIAVVEHQGAFLVGRRPEGVPLAGYWEFPGGKVHAGETPATAALRECQEETGLAVEALAAYPEVVHDYAHGRLRLCFFACRLAENVNAPPREPFQWVTRADLAALAFPPANAELVRAIVAG